jgi:putative FmdB family regulatory protein
MATYEYRCAKDNSYVVMTRSIDDRDKSVPCPECNSDMSRIYNATPVHFKGSGFYSTGG